MSYGTYATIGSMHVKTFFVIIVEMKQETRLFSSKVLVSRMKMIFLYRLNFRLKNFEAASFNAR